jgi:soluble lytic murein transglycosylase-like protein
MLRAIVSCSGFAVLAFAALAQPASASWPFDAGTQHVSRRAAPQVFHQTVGQVRGQIAGRWVRRTSREIAGGAASQIPAQASAYEAMITQHASANGVPPSLIHRVIMRESRYNASAVSAGNYGLMQIRLATARAMGYSGSAAGLLDPETNMTYAVRYLAGAYRAAGGNEARAVALYASGY